VLSGALRAVSTTTHYGVLVMKKPVFDLWSIDRNTSEETPDYADTPVFPVGRIGRTLGGVRFLVLTKQEHDARPGECLAIVSRGDGPHEPGSVLHFSKVLNIKYFGAPTFGSMHETIIWEWEEE
jgi:hypothetical protein